MAAVSNSLCSPLQAIFYVAKHNLKANIDAKTRYKIFAELGLDQSLFQWSLVYCMTGGSCDIITSSFHRPQAGNMSGSGQNVTFSSIGTDSSV